MVYTKTPIFFRQLKTEQGHPHLTVPDYELNIPGLLTLFTLLGISLLVDNPSYQQGHSSRTAALSDTAVTSRVTYQLRHSLLRTNRSKVVPGSKISHPMMHRTIWHHQEWFQRFPVLSACPVHTEMVTNPTGTHMHACNQCGSLLAIRPVVAMLEV